MNPDDKETISLNPKLCPTSSNFEAGINLLKCSIGIGILSLPYYFNAAGYLLSSIMMIIISIMTFYATLKIIELAEIKELKVTNFEELYRNDVGKTVFIGFQICMATGYMGVCVCYVIFFLNFFNNIFNTSSMYYTLLYAFITLCIIIPLSMIRNFHFFVKYSFLANILIFIVLSAIFEYCLTNLNLEEMDNLATFSELPGILGVFIFAFESPGQLLSIRNSMKTRSDFKMTFLIVNFFVLFIYISLAVLCCLGFSQSQLTQNILTGFGEINQYYLMLQGFYAIALVLTYPIQLNPLLEVLENIPKIKVFIENNQGNFVYKNCVRILVTLIIFPLGIFITNLADFISLVGTLTGLVIQFIIPLWAYNKYFGDKLNVYVKWLHYFIIGVSVVGTVCASYYNLVTLIEDF